MTEPTTPQPTEPAMPEPDLTDSQRRFSFGLLYDVMKALEAHDFGPFNGPQLVQLQQHLFHFLYGDADDRCYGKSAASVEPITDIEAHRAEVARKLAELRQSGVAVDAALDRYDQRWGIEQ